jgi:hypothetical protein
MKSKILLIMFIGLFLVSSAAMADVINLTSGGAWNNLSTVTIGNSGLPFWNYTSGDGNPPGNIGSVIPTYIPSNAQYWSLSGAVDPNIFFTGIGAGQTLTLNVEYAGHNTTNEIWVYDKTNPATERRIFNGAATAGATDSLGISYASYGFYLKDTLSGKKFYSTTGLGTESGHFALFRDSTLPNTWWFGVEDLITSGSDKDFQDLVFQLQVQPGGGSVPLPPSVYLMGSGLLGLGLLRWRRLRGTN